MTTTAYAYPLRLRAWRRRSPEDSHPLAVIPAGLSQMFVIGDLAGIQRRFLSSPLEGEGRVRGRKPWIPDKKLSRMTKMKSLS